MSGSKLITEHRTLHVEQTPLERARLWIEILAFIAAGCWAIYTFLYQTRIAPLFEPGHEVYAVTVDRIGQTPTAYLERVQVTIRNDGSVPVDIVAMAVDAYGLRSSPRVRWTTDIATSSDRQSEEMTAGSWQPLAVGGMLFDGAVDGVRGQHAILHPGDTVPFQNVFAVPRNLYDILRVHVEAVYDRYPVVPRIPVHFRRGRDGGILLSKGKSISFDTYFGV